MHVDVGVDVDVVVDVDVDADVVVHVNDYDPDYGRRELPSKKSVAELCYISPSRTLAE